MHIDLTSPDCELDDFYKLKSNDLLFARTGASTGKTYLYSSDDGNVYFAGYLIRFRINKTINASFIFFQTKTKKFQNWIKIYSKRSGQPGINAYEYGKYRFALCSIEEQNKIAIFLDILDKKMKFLKAKIETLKKYKEGLDIFAYNFVKKYGNYIRFCDLFENKVIKNTNNIQQFTVGKHGIKKLEESNYDVSKHKVFRNDDLIIGIGIDEMAISNVTKGSVSPVYDVFTMTDKNYLNCLKTTLKRQLWHNRNFITKKSTRREFEVDKKRLSKTILLVVENNIFSNIYESIFKAERTIEILNKKSNNLRKAKLYFLNKMFI